MRHIQPAEEVAGMPTHCPTCHSPDVKTASKVIDSSTYWRCAACGEVWNVGRRRAAGRYDPPRRRYP